MSYRLTDWALDVDGISPTQKLVLAVLARYCNGVNGSAKCWPSMATLVHKTGYSDRAIQKALASLEELCLIERRVGSGKATTVYRLAGRDSPNRCLDLEGLSTPAPGAPPPNDVRGSPPNEVRPTPERGSLTPERRSGVKGKEQGREQGGKRETQDRAPRERACEAAGAALSEPLGPRWREIARATRPDLADPSHTRAKFEAHTEGRAWDQATADRAWKLWLLRERENHGERYTEQRDVEREPGSFLCNIPPRTDDLTAEYHREDHHDDP